ncbi:MAG TPA: alpha/beta fold hydrolase [Symbiobacteriaceae bacterium]|nr:alpha/beta fold hydrolase [Symbiobacteriaceae bacterium]
MKRTVRHLVAVLLAVLVILPMAGLGAAAPAPDPNLVPLRAVAEAAGAKVEWHADTWSVTVTRGEVTLDLKIGGQTATINGVQTPVGTAVALVDGKTMIPLPFLKAALGVEVAWDAAAGKPVFDARATEAMSFLKSAFQGKADPKTLTPGLQAVVNAQYVAALAAQMKQLGDLGQMAVMGHTKNAVHENVQVLVVMTRAALDVTVRFDANGLVDDLYMNVYAGPTFPAGAPAYADPALFTEKEVVVGAGTAFPLPGTLSMPVGQGPFPAVVFVHGSGPNDRDEAVGGIKVFRDLAQGLASRGIAVLRYEKRTREHSQKSIMLPHFGLQAETIEDALLAAKLLKGEAGVDPRRIFVLGHSQGALAVPMLIDQDAEKVLAGGIIAAGPNSMPDTLLLQNRLLVEAKLLPEAQLPFIEQQVAMLRDPAFDPAKPPQGFALGMPQYWFDMRDPVAPLAKQQTLPLFIFQGARDFQVPVAQFADWQKELAGRDGVTFKLYPKLNHAFTEGEGAYGFTDEYMKTANVPVYVIDDVANWIKDH